MLQPIVMGRGVDPPAGGRAGHRRRRCAARHRRRAAGRADRRGAQQRHARADGGGTRRPPRKPDAADSAVRTAGPRPRYRLRPADGRPSGAADPGADPAAARHGASSPASVSADRCRGPLLGGSGPSCRVRMAVVGRCRPRVAISRDRGLRRPAAGGFTALLQAAAQVRRASDSISPVPAGGHGGASARVTGSVDRVLTASMNCGTGSGWRLGDVRVRWAVGRGAGGGDRVGAGGRGRRADGIRDRRAGPAGAGRRQCGDRGRADAGMGPAPRAPGGPARSGRTGRAFALVGQLDLAQARCAAASSSSGPTSSRRRAAS